MSANLFELDLYEYELPERLIAQSPAHPRDSSRLMIINRQSGEFQHRSFSDLPEYFGNQDLLVANNSRVLPARLLGKRLLPDGQGGWKEGGAIEFLLLEKKGQNTWEGLFHASAKYVPGLRFRVPARIGFIEGEITIGSKDSPSGSVVARFDRDPVDSGSGTLPLPHYIRRSDSSVDDASDLSDYQTIYSKNPGSAAAPTAGLHFTRDVISRLAERGASWAEVTLNVGVGTFRPVKTTDIREHHMHSEKFEISQEAAAEITSAKKSGKKITAVGTTSVRTLESAWDDQAKALRAGAQETSIFLYPGGMPIRVCDHLITNFHLPKSSLLMLVSAFAGRELILSAYQEAIRLEYRFFSYGDAMLIL